MIVSFFLLMDFVLTGKEIDTQFLIVISAGAADRAAKPAAVEGDRGHFVQ